MAREALLDDLEAFARAVGHVAVQRDDDGLTVRFGLRGLRFEPMGEGDRLRVTLEGWPATADHRIYREQDLGDRWVLSYRKHGNEDRVPLFDKGLEELMVSGLGLPRPEPLPEAPMSPRTAAVMAGPDQDREPPLKVLQGRRDQTRDDKPAPKPKAPAKGGDEPPKKGPKKRQL